MREETFGKVLKEARLSLGLSQRNNVTPKELRVLSHISLLGVLKPRDYLFILNSIRQAIK